MHNASLQHTTRVTAAAPVIILVLIAAVVVVYYQVRGHEFIAYEDASGLVGFTRPEQAPGIFQAERPSIDTAPRRPVAEYVHALGVRLLGMQAGAHHLANVIFHTINSLLLYVFFLKATGESGKSGFVAAVFALHPLQVESVAWLAQRSVLLGTSFFLLAAVGYLWYAKQPRLPRYLIVCMCFVLGWLTDPVVGVLPLVLILMDYWPLARFPRFQDGFGSKRPFKEGTLLLIVEKVPLTVVSVFLWTAWAVARKQTMEGVALYEGIVRGLSNAAGYLLKMAAPLNLSIHYAFPGAVPWWKFTGIAVVLAGLSLVAVVQFKARPYLAVGWLWYLVTLACSHPTVMADRHSYLALIGPAIMVAWGVPDLIPAGRLKTALAFTAAAVLLFVFASLSWLQVRHWSDDVRLFSHAVAVNGNDPVAHNNLGASLLRRNSVYKAVWHFMRALEIKPDDERALTNLRTALEINQNRAQAIESVKRYLALYPQHSGLYYILGTFYIDGGERHEACESFKRALALHPPFTGARERLETARCGQEK